MIRHSFHVNYTGKDYSLILPTAMVPVQSFMGGPSQAEMVISSAIRSNEYARYISVPMFRAEIRQQQEFKEDFNLVINAFNSMHLPVTNSTFKQALLKVCTGHVNKYGRIWIADAMMYVDCAVYALKAINSWPDSECKICYSELASYIINALGNNLKYPSPYGNI